jgi:hypothetical protein
VLRCGRGGSWIRVSWTGIGIVGGVDFNALVHDQRKVKSIVDRGEEMNHGGGVEGDLEGGKSQEGRVDW